jgi:GAF domain-containing protein
MIQRRHIVNVPVSDPEQAWRRRLLNILLLAMAAAALRAINQLVVREKDRDRLLEGACRTFIETRSYHNAWIVLLDDESNVAATAEAGMEEEFLPLVAQVERGELVRCAQETLKRPGVVVTNVPISKCTDCPVSKHYGGRGAMTARLEHAGRVHGAISVPVPRALVTDSEEITLFHEVAEDIAFALRGI